MTNLTHDSSTPDAITGLERVEAANLDAWRMPGALDGMRVYPWGTYPAPISRVINVSEVAMHGWDVAVATDEVAEVSVPSTAPVQERVLGLLGRAA